LRELKRPILVLPNHPGFIDPVLVLASLWPQLRIRPLLYEEGLPGPLMSLIVKLLKAIRVPGLEQASVASRERIQEALDEVVASLRRGDNLVVWPAGRVERDGTEQLGAARATADFLKAVPQAQIVLVRTRGVWGSRFSYAFTGKAPN